MFNVSCEINEVKKNSTNKIHVLSVNEKNSYGYVEIKLGKESIVIDGFELQAAIENCTKNKGNLIRRNYSYDRRVAIDTDESEDE